MVTEKQRKAREKFIKNWAGKKAKRKKEKKAVKTATRRGKGIIHDKRRFKGGNKVIRRLEKLKTAVVKKNGG
jgi:hypothetical protein